MIIGKSSNYTIIIDKTLQSSSCKDKSCSLCYYNDSNFCIVCRNNISYVFDYTFYESKKCSPELPPTTIIIPETTYIISETTYIIPETTYINPQTTYIITQTTYIIPETTYIIPERTLPETTIPQQLSTYIEQTPLIQTTIPKAIPKIISTIPETSVYTSITDISKNLFDDILQGNFKGKLTNEEIGDVYNKLKESINTSQVIETENVIFQISTLEEQKYNINPNISSIDFGECEKKIKEKESLSPEDDLIVLKTDMNYGIYKCL